MSLLTHGIAWLNVVLIVDVKIIVLLGYVVIGGM